VTLSAGFGCVFRLFINAFDQQARAFLADCNGPYLPGSYVSSPRREEDISNQRLQNVLQMGEQLSGKADQTTMQPKVCLLITTLAHVLFTTLRGSEGARSPEKSQ